MSTAQAGRRGSACAGAPGGAGPPRRGPGRGTPADRLVVEVAAGLERRTRSLERRLGHGLAGYICRPGKMLRGRFCLSLGRALGVDDQARVAAAVIAELTHNASLLHDDCVDDARVRRGRATPNARYGTSVALLLGDLAVSLAFDAALDVSPDAARGLVDTCREMAIGELQEEFVKGSSGLTIESYTGIAGRKTGALFEWCGRAMSAMSPLAHDREAVAGLGRCAGVLLQIVDDIHDVTLEADVAGKEPGRDLAQGRPTLPALLALQDPAGGEAFRRLWDARDGAAAGRFLVDGGHLDRARRVGEDILADLRAAAAALPDKAGAAELDGFLTALALRKF